MTERECVDPNAVWEYCWNCGRPLYERQISNYCFRCEDLLNKNLKEFLKQKGVYLSLLETGRGLEAAVK